MQVLKLETYAAKKNLPDFFGAWQMGFANMSRGIFTIVDASLVLIRT